MTRRSMSKPPMVSIPIPPPMIIKPSIFSLIKDGFSFGIGSAIAHRVANNISSTSSPDNKKLRNLAYEQCLSENADFIDSASICAHYIIEAKEYK